MVLVQWSSLSDPAMKGYSMSFSEEFPESDFMVKRFEFDQVIPAGSKLLLVLNDLPEVPKWFVYEVPVIKNRETQE